MPAPPDDTRAALLDRALDLFTAYGYDGVGVQQICVAAGVTKPTLYHHFGAKRGLLRTLMETRLAALADALADAGALRRDLGAALAAIAEATFAYADGERSFYRLYLTLWFAPIRSEAYEIARGFHERHFAAVERVFRDAAECDPALAGRERALAAAFLGLINNHIGLALNNVAALTPKHARQTADGFLYGVLARPAQGKRQMTLPIGIEEAGS
ncbi:TetR family transcriptional regulator [Roseiarcus fermentans]|uniref:TetR family transcriptional regulator n=1 Tax=Roseiarcus fermentans TaxID=1473586 RepID=A0A366FCH2_9HYPH|nr:TetR/AcrR family transcriptional regulator [Roseiarcus fermentans]RBP12277.1 TetR family transcriptional regulator [Roseiarcus fermentans]